MTWHMQRAGLLALGLSLTPLLGGLAQAQESATAIFAGGCFWCVESDFDHVPGVTDTQSGYIGGTADTATYRQVGHVEQDHHEAVKITYDPAVTDYDKLLVAFWHSVDPLDPNGQFCDKGSSYRTAIFTQTPEETAAAEASKTAVEAELGQPVATQIIEGKEFYPAEDYHQNYYQTNSVQYQYYRFGCGRDARVEQVWGEKAYLGVEK